MTFYDISGASLLFFAFYWLGRGITRNTETDNLIVVYSANNNNSMLTALQPLDRSMENMETWERITDSPRKTR